MRGGELTKILKTAKRIGHHFSEEFCKYTLFCVANGLKDMHDKNILHRDIKSDNILFKDDGTIKICCCLAITNIVFFLLVIKLLTLASVCN